MMKRWLCTATVVAVAGLGLLMFPTRSEAQRRGGRTVTRNVTVNRGTRVNIGVGRGWGYGRGWGWGYGRGWGWGPGWGWRGRGWGWGYGPGVIYGGGSYVYDAVPVYDGAAYPYSADNGYVYEEGAPADASVSQSAYPPDQATSSEGDEDQQGGSVARVTVRLPSANATLWFNGARMLAQGQTRTFTTPPLDANQDYHYRVRVRFMQNGQPVVRTRVLNIRAGQTYNLDLSRGDDGAQPAATGGQRQGREVIGDEDRGTDRNQRPQDIRRPRDNDRNPSRTPPGDVNRQGGNRTGDLNRDSDTNGRSQPNRNPAGSNPNPRPSDE